MKHDTLFAVAPVQAGSTVTILQFRGRLALDPDPLAEIYAAQGEDVAEETVCRTLANLANRISAIQDHHRQSAFGDIPLPARRVAAIAGQIGLTEVALAATHLGNAATQADGVAIEATLSRLERCFDLAMSEVWSFRDSV
ncbi:hypothetical protein SAMN04488515_2566 [Cognatiyoonia koreensis]|uniref:Uncharacterized protein n=1 Tax=Cognatiyoonia koreensis TaxID=364200 RepID=A0A1I0RES8_9RHOB|nr:hypothetical protein [Cognatiyoonia koreensis]SEW39190.1 hypothetical protein SAMN04488515_2566 [Cognatiyoonia koreensis]